MEKRQVPLYFAAIILGASLAVLVPAFTLRLDQLINPALALLLFIMFLTIPVREFIQSWSNTKFIAALLFSNFLVAPLVCYLLIRIFQLEPELSFGVLLVLLTPCIDYVVVFSQAAGGNSKQLLASTPVLLLFQVLLLPIYFNLFYPNPEILGSAWEPILLAFTLTVLLPFVAAVLLEFHISRSASSSKPARVKAFIISAMVPLMMLVLLLVVATQLPVVLPELSSLSRLIPLYLLFSLLMAVAGFGIAKAFKNTNENAISVAFSATTRNSLVVLPIALAVTETLPLAAVTVVSQTMVELIVMLVLIQFFRRKPSVV